MSEKICLWVGESAKAGSQMPGIPAKQEQWHRPGEGRGFTEEAVVYSAGRSREVKGDDLAPLHVVIYCVR